MNMKKLVALLLALVMVFALCACGPKDNQDTGKKDDGKKTAMKADDIPDEMTSSDGKYQVAFVTDVGDLKDKSFNQGTYDGVKLYASANSKSYKYYKPANGDKATDDDRYDAMKAAVDNGAEVVVAAGFLQGAALEKAAKEFKDTKFVFIDGWAFDELTNLAAINFREEQCGYLAGYAAVMEGYTKLGFTGGGGGTNDACCRYGYGYVQGAEAAAAAKNGKVAAILGINYDISSLLMVEDAVHELIDTKDKTQGEPEKIVNVNNLLDELIAQSVALVGKPVALMNKEDKMRAIGFLSQSGAFLVTKSGDKIAKYFGISKYTLYSYIDKQQEEK